MDFNIPGTRRSSRPAGNSSQSGNGGVILPGTLDADLPPTLSHSTSSLLKDMPTPEDIQGASDGSSVMVSVASLAGTGLTGYGFGRGRNWVATMLSDEEEPMPTKPMLLKSTVVAGTFPILPPSPPHPIHIPLS